VNTGFCGCLNGSSQHTMRPSVEPPVTPPAPTFREAVLKALAAYGMRHGIIPSAVRDIAALHEAEVKKWRDILEELVALTDSEDPVEVGCHCTSTDGQKITCCWCRASAILGGAS
jgi:hypothetical protein